MRAALGAALFASGCAVQVGSWSAATLERALISARTPAVRGQFEGRSCRWFLLGVPLGLPQIDEALADALRRGRGAAMLNLTVTSEHSFWGLAGRHCYAVKGDVVG